MTADEVRDAYERRDLDAFAALLAEDVTWGDVGTPRGCRNRDEVLATYRELMTSGLDVEVVSASEAPAGVIVQLRLPDRDRWQLMRVQDGRIAEICGFDDAESAAEAGQG